MEGRQFAVPPLLDTLQSAHYLEFAHLAHQVRGYQRTRRLTVPVTPNYISGIFDSASSQPRLRARQRTLLEKVDAILQSLDFQNSGRLSCGIILLSSSSKRSFGSTNTHAPSLRNQFSQRCIRYTHGARHYNHRQSQPFMQARS